jgi:hypothetical protein
MGSGFKSLVGHPERGAREITLPQGPGPSPSYLKRVLIVNHTGRRVHHFHGCGEALCMESQSNLA